MSSRTARAVFLMIALLVFLPDRIATAQGVRQPFRESDGCEVPSFTPGLLQLTIALVNPSGSFLLPPPSGVPHLVIPCLEFDRSAYRVGEMWGATFTVTNAGSATSGTFSIFAELCRHMANGITFSCAVGVFPLTLGEAALASGESRAILTSTGWGFDGLPADPPGDYESLVEGVPDNGTVYLRATTVLGEFTMASAMYPSGPAPSGPASGPDADEDGYTAPPDCDDANPAIHPDAAEVVDTGIDEDCSGGDAGETPDCPAGSLISYGECLSAAIGSPVDPSELDLDGDGFNTSEGDCDDTQFIVHPGAIEFQDGLDNNCNGEIDEVLGTPDFTLTATAEDDTQALGSLSSITEPGIRYVVEVLNQGAGIPVPLESIQAVLVEAPSDPDFLGTGTTGFIPLRLIPDTACTGGTLRFSVADNGIYGEIEFANNVFELEWPGEQLSNPNLDLRFDDTPSVLYDNDEDGSIRIIAYHLTEGTCPPLPISFGVPRVSTRHRVWQNGTLVHNTTTFNVSSSFAPSDRLNRLDRICVAVGLNDPAFSAESPANNGWVGAYEFRNPLFGPAELRLIDSGIGDPASLSCVEWSAGESETPIVGEATGGLTGSALTAAPIIGGVGGGLLLAAAGGLLGSFAARRFGFLPARSLATGAAAGFVAGGVSGVLFLSALANDRVPQLDFQLPPDPRQAAALASCDFYLDATTSSPFDGTIFNPGDVLSVDLEPVAGRELPPDAYALLVRAPSGQEVWGPWPAASGNPGPLDLVGLALTYPTRFVFSPGIYTWSVIAGFREELGGAPVCRHSTPHSFTIEVPSELGPVSPEAPSVAPSSTPTAPVATVGPAVPPATVALPPTATRTPTAVPDTAGPSIKSVSDSPDPIKVAQPKGCAPTTSMVTASISDPSGVASAEVIFFHTTIGSVAMTNTGGTTWQATLGPYTGVGDGTVDYQIRAVDNQGNTTDSAFYQITVLACIP